MTFPDSTTPAGNGTIPATGGAAAVAGSIAPAADCPFDLPLGPPVILPAILPASQADWPEILAVLETANMHHIPSPEMPEFDLACAFVVRLVGKLVGVAGYKVLSPTTAKTTLLAVLPEARRCGVGRLLQERRRDALCALGIRTLTTNSDRPETIAAQAAPLRRNGHRPLDHAGD